ncbi:Creatinase/aminopeptidase [Thozetella sp. PMI_491]|nr:Creatinase/aminopeptidase [Thozetella sp. PMI_491]
MAPIDTSAQLAKLRALMKERKLDVYIIPSEDSHASEYIADCDARRKFICGFSGSSGTAVVTLDKAAMATDGRYFNQASQQLDSSWQLLKTGLPDVLTWQEWAADEAKDGKTVGVDPTLVSSVIAEKLDSKIKKGGGAGLQPVSENLVDLAWGSGRPPRPTNPIVLLHEKYTGKDTKTKLADLRKELEKKKTRGLVVSELDEIAWLFNLRGSDIDFNPVFFSYAVVTADSASFYVDESKLGADCKSYLAENNVVVKPYDALFNDAASLAASAQQKGESSQAAEKFTISKKASWALKLALGGEKLVEEMRSPVEDAKAAKNDVEQEGARQCHIRDGAALIQYFAWLEDQLVNKKATLSEAEAADKLEELRSQKDLFKGLSFPTISSTGPNAAVIHYKPEHGTCATIDPNAIYLCDSGAQYLDGTTDTTRTLHFGTPTAAEKKANTLVLKGNIALDMAVFPKGTTGYSIDSLARQFLWQEGLDYRHGTGHGVGSYLNVHEGPVGIGTRKAYADVSLSPGNLVSIEPGYYEDGVFGIRIENMAIVREVKTNHTFGDKAYLGFEHVTMVPFCRSLIDIDLLTQKEKDWLNAYSADILNKMEGFFKDDEVTLAWLKKETQPFEEALWLGGRRFV